MREASTALAEGRVADTLRAYNRHGTVRWSTDRNAACWNLVDSYLHDRERHPDTSRLVLARRNADVDELNALIRLHRHRLDELGAAIRVGGRKIAVHDRVVFTRNDPFERRVQTLGLSRRRSGSDPDERAGVQNGTFGNVLAVRRAEVRVRLDDGRMVRFDPRRHPHLRHGYAATLHKGQGATVDRSFVLLDPRLGLDGTYVAATRHRDHLELWLDRRSFADLYAASVAFGRRGPNDLLARREDPDGGSDESRALDRLRSMVERQAVVTWDDLPERPEDRSRQPTRRVAARPARSRPVASKTAASAKRPVVMSDLEIACLLAPDRYQPLFESLLDQVRKQERTQARARQRERGGGEPDW